MRSGRVVMPEIADRLFDECDEGTELDLGQALSALAVLELIGRKG